MWTRLLDSHGHIFRRTDGSQGRILCLRMANVMTQLLLLSVLRCNIQILTKRWWKCLSRKFLAYRLSLYVFFQAGIVSFRISYSQPMDIRMNVDSPDFDFSQRHSNHQGIMSFSQPYGTHMGESPTPNEGRFMGSLVSRSIIRLELAGNSRLSFYIITVTSQSRWYSWYFPVRATDAIL